MRLIDADKLIEDLKNPELVNVFPIVFRVIGEQKTIDQIKHGEWMATEMRGTNARKIKYHILKCSICGKSNGRKKNNYCPNCGANMEI